MEKCRGRFVRGVCLVTAVVLHLGLAVSGSAFDSLNAMRNAPFAFEALRVYSDLMKALPKTQGSESSQCLNDIDSVIKEAFSGKTWALKMIDSSTKIPSGLLQGNIVDLGEFDECVDIGNETAPTNIQTHHCLISLNVLVNSSALESQGTSDALGGSLTLKFSWCLPKSCSPAEISRMLNEGISLIMRVIFPATSNSAIKIDSVSCHNKDYVPFSFMEWFAIGTCLTIGLIALLSTLYDWFRRRDEASDYIDFRKKTDLCYSYTYKDTTRFHYDSDSTKYKLLSSFSVLSNGKKLLTSRSSAEQFHVINCLKVVSIFWVIMGHKYRITAENPLLNLLELPDYIKYLKSMILLNATLSVDVFFTISGFLVTYGYLKMGQTKNYTLGTHAVYILYRYLRLTPAFALMILLTSTLLYRLGDGPMWDSIVGNAKQQCETYWWAGLLYINNYYNPTNSCMMQSWYLAADTQLYLLAPLVLFPLLKWPRWGLLLVAICTGLSVAIPFYVAYTEEIKAPIALSRNTEKVRRETNALYLPTHTKSISYVIGILLGYILFEIKVKKAVFRIKKRTNIIIWILAVTLLLASLLGGYPFFQLDSTYNKWESSLYIGFYRLGWSLGIAWIILACTTGHGGFVNTIASRNIFAPLGRLTYCVYLVHVAVIMVGVGRMRTARYFDNYNILTEVCGIFFISTIFAFILSVLTESPLMVIEKIILRRESKQS